jgi:Patatin-like phospholipase
MPIALLSLQTFFTKQRHNRTYWLALTLLIASLIGFVQSKLDGRDMHALAGQLAAGGLNPFGILKQWHQSQSYQWWLALLEVLIDTLLFIPAYFVTLSIWCQYFATHSLFVTNPYRPNLAVWMRRIGMGLVVGLCVGIIADLIETVVMLGWLLGGGWSEHVPSWLMALIQVAKMTPIGLATWYVLLHPLGLLLSVREAFFGLLKLGGRDQEQTRQSLLNFIIDRHQYEEAIDRAIGEQRRQATGPALAFSLGSRLRTAWRGFLNVQFVFYIILFLLVLFTQLDQFDELFYFLMTEARGIGVLFCTLGALWLLGGMLYVCSRILLFIQPTYFVSINAIAPHDDDLRKAQKIQEAAAAIEQNRPTLSLLRNVPAWLGHAPFWVMAFTLMLNFGRLSNLDQQNPAFAFKYASILLVLAGNYALFTWVLRRLDRQTNQSSDETNIALFRSTNPARDYALLVDLAPRSILFGQGLLVAALMLFLPSSTGLGLSQTIGLYAVVVLWLAALAYLGTLLYQFNNLPNYPIVLGLLLAVLAFSYVNDNSAIRHSPEVYDSLSQSVTSTTQLRPSIEAQYTQWLLTRGAFDRTTDSVPLPVVVVATAGGGIRAATWTTEALLAVNQRIPGFDQHVFAISGVSGGGVGAATYLATLAGQDSTTRTQYALVGPDSAVTERIRAVVTHDLISPTAASMLFRGGIHNVIPFPVATLDRNRWLEDAWEKRLLSPNYLPDSAIRERLSRSFLSLWPALARPDTSRPAPPEFPSLLLNGAIAETGQKIVMSNLNLGNTTQRDNTFYDVVDLFASTNHDVPYKTATFLCARFPFVTSGGKATGTLPNIVTDHRQTDYHIIDGGYAENTGIVSAVQLIKELQRVSQRLSNTGRLSRQVAYYLLFLPNYAPAENASSVQTFRFLAEPVKGFLNTWNRNGVSLDQLVGYTLQRSQNELSFSYTSLMLNTRKHRYPLGWYISPTAARRMSQQAKDDIDALLTDTSATAVIPRIRLQIRQFSVTNRRPKG